VIGHLDKKLVVYHWIMDDPDALNVAFMPLYDAHTTAEAVAAAHRLGIADENFLAADSAGHIAWTIAGRLPKRIGYTGRWNTYWEYRDREWDGFLPPDEVPTVTDQPYLWSANQRMLGGDALTKLGDGGYIRAARGAQLKADLAALAKGSAAPRPLDLLDIELDDQAEFLSWWRDLALKHLPAGDVHDAVANDSARAEAGSKGYRFVREFRQRVAHAVLDPIFASCAEDDETFTWMRLNYEPALRELLTKQPAHLLDPSYRSWDSLIAAQLKAQGTSLPTWGARNRLAIRHPFSRVLPSFLTSWMNQPSVPMPGDTDMPRVQAPGFGASERFAVSPGHEDQGIFEMPGGESGHPLSPFYSAGHQDWVEGKPSPFLPGPTAHTLMLQPE
jgi:penicillin amidase